MNIKHLNQIGDKVIVKKGEGGGSEGGGSSWKYFDITALADEAKASMAGIGHIVLARTDNIFMVMPSGSITGNATKNIKALAYDASVLSASIFGSAELELQPYGEWMQASGGLQALLQMGAIEITKEEFYSL